MTTLDSFLEAEKKELEEKVYGTTADHELPDWLSSHDTRLLAFVREMINAEGFNNPSEAGQFALHADGYNQAIEDIIDLLTPPTKVTDTK